MNAGDLGPLERRILDAVVLFELAGIAPGPGLIWRGLPGYETALANVLAALGEGLPLRGWLLERDGLYCCRDHGHLPRTMAAARQRALARWEQARPLLLGLSRLPWVEALAVVGPMAWGLLPSVCDPCAFAAIAEGGRTGQARVALRARLRAAGQAGEGLRLLRVFDASALSLDEPGAGAALILATARPVTNLAAWEAMRAANPWWQRRFPCADLRAPELPDMLEGRTFGKLAALRRRIVIRDGGGTLLLREDRRRGVLDWLEARLLVAAREEDPGLDSLLGVGLGAALERRRGDLERWEVAGSAEAEEAEAEAEPPDEEARPHASTLPGSEPAAERAHPPPPADGPAAAIPAPARSRRSRRPRVRAPRELRSPAAGQPGQRLQGVGRRRKRRR